jgi:hypothetical protein
MKIEDALKNHIGIEYPYERSYARLLEFIRRKAPLILIENEIKILINHISSQINLNNKKFLEDIEEIDYVENDLKKCIKLFKLKYAKINKMIYLNLDKQKILLELEHFFPSLTALYYCYKDNFNLKKDVI